MSVYALTRGVAAILFAPAIGHYIDVGNRLQVVRVSIVLQRIVVAISCIIFYLLATSMSMESAFEKGALAVLALLACVEKLCSIMNLVSVERDWVVVVARDDPRSLATMNAEMRRIDMVCKLIGPLFIALLDGISTEAAILVNLGMNIFSVVVEYFTIARVYGRVPELQQPKQILDPVPQKSPLWKRCGDLFKKSILDFKFHFHHRAFLPSFAGALLYLTVLSFSGQMVTWLLSTGYDSMRIGLARTLSVAFEILSTWTAPWLVGRIGPVRAGLWLASWEIISLVAGISAYWAFQSRATVSASGLVGGTIVSRLGLRGFDLCAQIIVQDTVEPEYRGSFSSVEAAWQNAFEICSYMSTIVFSRPEQFKWPALISVVAVGFAGLLYALFVLIQRGHLVHVPKSFGF
ncbi:uncharacterized protein LDX57_012022 [Aspergillus melleus]|uniref:uncharacterized protein n=1 Tax=Aspergillus melleus TaxID=138277 RepID=UPI001E8E272E|nr:uncharacterized protein LDX57_012022 [Aspergillus melleus]KAH8434374.1 hypothetical protein LDX57_012022 [Aspergillus melleus]